MTYFLVSRDGNGGYTLETLEAKDTKAALLHIVDAWSGFSKDDDYQECKHMSVDEIGEYLVNMNMNSGDVTDLMLFEAAGVSEFGMGEPRNPVWSIFNYVNAKHIL